MWIVWTKWWEYFTYYFSCKVAQHIWWRWYTLLKIQTVSHIIPCDYFRQISHGLQGRKANSWWVVGWSSIIWNLWHQRNNIIFEEQVLVEDNLWHKILFDMWSWLKTYQSDFDISFQQWQVNPDISLAVSWDAIIFRSCGNWFIMILKLRIFSYAIS